MPGTMNIFDILYYIERHDLRVYKIELFSKVWNPYSHRYDRRSGLINCAQVTSIIYWCWPYSEQPDYTEWNNYTINILASILSDFGIESSSNKEIELFSRRTKFDPTKVNFREFNKRFINELHKYWQKTVEELGVTPNKEQSNEEDLGILKINDSYRLMTEAKSKGADSKEYKDAESEFLKSCNIMLNTISNKKNTPHSIPINSATIYCWGHEVLTLTVDNLRNEGDIDHKI